MTEIPSAPSRALLYGRPPLELGLDWPADGTQVSPLVPGAAALEELPEAAFDGASILAPPGTVERRAALAGLLRALKSGAPLRALAPNDKGGRRLANELAAFGCAVATESRRHFRLAETLRPEAPVGLAEAIAAGAPRFDENLGLWTQAGAFAADRIDPGSRMLLDHLPPLSGRGVDLGCGVGVLGHGVLRSDAVATLVGIEIDRRAVDCARRNLADPRAELRWADALDPHPDLTELDFAVTNPPFHAGGAEDRTLGQGFIRRAAAMLRRGGTLFVVANRHLPYEAVMRERFSRVAMLADANGYKLLEGRR